MLKMKFDFLFERAVQLTINCTQSSLCFCCYNYQSFYVLGPSCSSLEQYFGFDAQLLVSHRFHLKKEYLISRCCCQLWKAITAAIFYVSSKRTYETFQSAVSECFTTCILFSLSNPLTWCFRCVMDPIHIVASLKNNTRKFLHVWYFTPQVILSVWLSAYEEVV